MKSSSNCRRDLTSCIRGLGDRRSRPSGCCARCCCKCFSVRSERMLMDQLSCNMLSRWFVGLNMDDVVWDATTFSKNRDRLLRGEIAEEFFAAVLDLACG